MATAASLLSASAVRTRTRLVYEAGLRGELGHFAVHRERLPACARYVADTIGQAYPTLDVPPHSRWRHLGANGTDWSLRLGPHLATDRLERARQRFDLAIISVLLDAGAGAHWSWRDPVTGRTFSRSEGLALASLEAFREGLFSSDPAQPCRADAQALRTLPADRLVRVFQVSADNPLSGMDGRIALLERLGRAIGAHPAVYGTPARVGALFDHCSAHASDKAVSAPDVLAVVLTSLGAIWPGRSVLDGLNLGDTWRHPAVARARTDAEPGALPQAVAVLTYSLIEPLQEAGLTVADLDGLTGLAEYRNGGLFIDTGVIAPRDPALSAQPLTPDQEPIVEWRALTVALLDDIAPLVRDELGVTAARMPLASILEGGTWNAGRRIARELRTGGPPPLAIVSDGTVF